MKTIELSAIWSAAWAFGGSAWAAEPITIADLAPPESALVAGVDDAAAMWQAFDRTGLRAVWDDPAFKEWFNNHAKQASEEFADTLEALGLDWDDLKRPTGAMGVALWFRDGGGAPAPAILLAADFGDDAEDLDETVRRALARAKDRGDIDLAEEAHNGVDVHAVRLADPDPDDLLSLDALFYARIGPMLLASSDRPALERAIDRLQGDRVPAIEDDAIFKRARAAVGRCHGFLVALAPPLRKWLANLVKTEAEPGDPDPDRLASALGLDAVQALTSAWRLDTDDAMLEQTYSILTDGKPGLIGLFEAPAMRFDPPAFVAAGASAVVLLQFNFAGVIPLINKVVELLPEETRGFIGPQVQMASMTMGPILANLGPEVWMVERLDRPLSASSKKQVWAMRVRDAAALQQAVAGALPMIGFASRDFQGNQVWSPMPGGFMPADSVALGLGFGVMFLGPTTAVEDAMRHAGAADNPKLADEQPFRDATRALGRGIGFGYWNFASALDWMDWSGRNIDKVIAERTRAMFGGEDPADDEEKQWRDDARRDMLDSIPSWIKDPPPTDVLRRHLGDSVIEASSTDDGFRARSLWLRPRE